jgi:hypothetical protein
MRIVFYARPWSTDLMLAVEDHWRRTRRDVDVLWITSHIEAVRMLARIGREATFLPGAAREIAVPDARRALTEIEARHAGELLPLMRYLLADRTIADQPTEWQIDQLARHALFFEALFDREQPDAIIGEASDTMPSWLGFELARLHGCTPLGLTPSAVPPGRLLILRTHEEIAGARERYERLRDVGLDPEQERAARALQDVVLGRGAKLDYLPPLRRPLAFAKRVLTGAVAGRQVAVALERARERRAGNWFTQPNPIVHWIRTRGHLVRARIATRRYLNQPLSGRPFVFYPLQYQPEASTLVHGSYFEDQLALLWNLARSIPGGWDLVVKEHFYMAGQRSLSFYKELRRIPNLRLVPFSVPTNELIQNAEVVAVITSTCGLEASLIGRPVIMFGEYPWDYAPTVHKVGAFTDLPALIRHAAGSARGAAHPDVLAFAASWDAALPHGRYYNNRQHDWLREDNRVRIADALWAAAAGDAGAAAAGGPLQGAGR